MTRSAAVVAAVLVFAAGAALHPSSSYAGTGVEDAVIDDSANWTSIQKLLSGDASGAIPTSDLYAAAGGAGGTYDPALAAEIAGGLDEAAAVGGIGGLSMAQVLPLFAIPAAFYTGWQIGSGIDHWLHISSYLGADPGTIGTGYAEAGTQWYYVECGIASDGSGLAVNPINSQTYPVGVCADVGDYYGFVPGDGQRAAGWFAVFKRTSGVVDTNFYGATVGGVGQDSVLRDAELQYATAVGTTNVTFIDLSLGGSPEQFRGSLWATPAQMARMRVLTSPVLTTDPGSTDTTIFAPSTTTTNVTSCTTSSGCATKIRTYIKTNTITEKWIVHQLDPGVEPDDPAVPAPIPLLQPETNETYSDYIARLVAAGLVGTTTTVTETTDRVGYGPNAVTRVSYTDTHGETHVFDPLSWPDPVPTIAPSTTVTIKHNGADAEPAPTDGGPPSGTTDTLDFRPLTSLDFGCKFPYGIFCYASEFTGYFDVSPVAPDFNLPIADVVVLGHTYMTGTHYDVNLDVADDYMSLLRGIESVVLWVGAVWMFCTRILGLNFGDPAEASGDLDW